MSVSLSAAARRFRRTRVAFAALLAWTLATIPGQAAEPVRFEVDWSPGRSSHVSSILEVGGELKLDEKGTAKNLKMSVVGKISYDERLLAAQQDKQAFRSVRSYQTADATIKIEKETTRPQLRPDRKLIVADAVDLKATLTSPEGPLTRDELDLLELPGNSLVLDQLLPSGPVKVGDRWKHANELMAVLLELDAVADSDVQSELKDADGTVAHFEMEGTVHGAVAGVATDLRVKARYKYRNEPKRITWFALLIEEKRPAGSVGPGADVVAKLQVEITAPSDAAALESIAEGLAKTEGQATALLEYLSPSGQYSFVHDRRWYPMAEHRDTLAMRMVDRGALIAQCNVSHLAKVDPQQLPALPKFQEDVQKALGKNFQRFAQATESSTSSGNKIFRVVAEGNASELPIRWIYYLVSNAEGRQVVFAFTVEETLVERLGDVDQDLVRTLEFKTPAPASVAKEPTLAKPRK